jgi:acyl-CoA thioester hydrolase
MSSPDWATDPPALTRAQPQARAAYPAFRPIGTRWMDNDVYGHVNNVVYYSFFDTAVNGHLVDAGALDVHAGAVIGLVIETHCHFFSPLAFPQSVEAGLRRATSCMSMWTATAAGPSNCRPCCGRRWHP